VQRRLGSVKIAEQADQCGKNLQRFGAGEGGAGHERWIVYTQIGAGEPRELCERRTPTGS